MCFISTEQGGGGGGIKTFLTVAVLPKLIKSCIHLSTIRPLTGKEGFSAGVGGGGWGAACFSSE